MSPIQKQLELSSAYFRVVGHVMGAQLRLATVLTQSMIEAPFAHVRGRTFFAYAGANADGISHFRTLGTNLFGLEDTFGGGDRDFDDHVIGFNFNQLV